MSYCVHRLGGKHRTLESFRTTFTANVKLCHVTKFSVYLWFAFHYFHKGGSCYVHLSDLFWTSLHLYIFQFDKNSQLTSFRCSLRKRDFEPLYMLLATWPGSSQFELACTQTLFYFPSRSFQKHRRARERSERARTSAERLFSSSPSLPPYAGRQ